MTCPPLPPLAPSTTTPPPSPPSPSTPLPPIPPDLLSADADDSFSLFDADDFVHLKILPSIHRHAVNNLTLHPSGKLTLSIGRDEFLAMVNLVRGQRNFCCLLGKEASLMRFDSIAGDKFFIAMEDKVTVHKAEDARLFFELDFHLQLTLYSILMKYIIIVIDYTSSLMSKSKWESSELFFLGDSVEDRARKNKGYDAYLDIDRVTEYFSELELKLHMLTENDIRETN